MITNLVRKQILQMQEINWGDIPENGMRLLWGENPVIAKDTVRIMQKEAMNVNLYPSPTQKELKQKLAIYNRVSMENIVISNGSDDAIELICKVFISEGDEVIIPIPSFPIYASSSFLMGASIKEVQLEKDFSLDVRKVFAAVTNKTKIIWLANPNNPTGNMLLNNSQIELLAKKTKGLIAIDECYFEFSQETAISLLKKYPNIILLRSFSKAFSLAGLRLGYIIASKEVSIYLQRLRSTNEVFSVNRLALAAGMQVCKDKKTLQKSIITYQNLKQTFEKSLATIPGIEIVPTLTAFSLLRIVNSRISSVEIKEKLTKKAIFIKDCSMYKGLGDRYIYLGVPAKKYQNKVIQAIKKAIKE